MPYEFRRFSVRTAGGCAWRARYFYLFGRVPRFYIGINPDHGNKPPYLVAGSSTVALSHTRNHAGGLASSGCDCQAFGGNTSRREYGSGHGGSVPGSGTRWTVDGAGSRNSH